MHVRAFENDPIRLVALGESGPAALFGLWRGRAPGTKRPFLAGALAARSDSIRSFSLAKRRGAKRSGRAMKGWVSRRRSGDPFALPQAPPASPASRASLVRGHRIRASEPFKRSTPRQAIGTEASSRHLDHRGYAKTGGRLPGCRRGLHVRTKREAHV